MWSCRNWQQMLRNITRLSMLAPCNSACTFSTETSIRPWYMYFSSASIVLGSKSCIWITFFSLSSIPKQKKLQINQSVSHQPIQRSNGKTNYQLSNQTVKLSNLLIIRYRKVRLSGKHTWVLGKWMNEALSYTAEWNKRGNQSTNQLCSRWWMFAISSINSNLALSQSYFRV